MLLLLVITTPSDGDTRMAQKCNTNMRLISLTTIFVVSSVLVAACAYYFFIVPSYVEVERENAIRNAQRLSFGIEQEVTQLDRLAKDYAHWNDSCDFLKTDEPSYLHSNFLNQMFEDNHLSFVAIYDIDDNLRFAKNYDLSSHLERPPHVDMYTAVFETFNKSARNTLKGIFKNNDKLQMVVVRSIMGSDGLGPSYGTMIFARPIDSMLINNLSRQLRVDANIRSVDTVKDASLLASFAPNHSTLVKQTDSEMLDVYFLMKDINKEVAAVANLLVPRNLFMHAQKRIFYAALFALGLIILMVLGLVSKVRYLLTHPFKKLSNALHQVHESNEIALPDSLYSYDELGGVLRECDALIGDLVACKAKQNYTRENSDLLKKVVPSAIFTVDCNKVITSWNLRAELLTGYSATEMIGKSCFLFANKPCQEKCGLFDHCDGEPIMGQECAIRHKNGSILTISKNADLLRNEDGEIVGGIECFEDISKRKLFEEALHWEVALNSCLAMLAQSILQCGGNEAYVADELLAYARNITGSSHGFVAERVFNDQQVLWGATSLFENVEVKSGFKTIFALANGRGSLLHAVYDSSAGIFFNSLDKLQGVNLTAGVSDSKEITHFMAVPVTYGDQIIGQVALANNENGYTKKDLQAVSQLAELFALVLTQMGRRQKFSSDRNNVPRQELSHNFA